jgi:hypothetical protein
MHSLSYRTRPRQKQGKSREHNREPKLDVAAAVTLLRGPNSAISAKLGIHPHTKQLTDKIRRYMVQNALTDQIDAAKSMGYEEYNVLISEHSIPNIFVENGDPQAAVIYMADQMSRYLVLPQTISSLPRPTNKHDMNDINWGVLLQSTEEEYKRDEEAKKVRAETYKVPYVQFSISNDIAGMGKDRLKKVVNQLAWLVNELAYYGLKANAALKEIHSLSNVNGKYEPGFQRVGTYGREYNIVNKTKVMLQREEISELNRQLVSERGEKRNLLNVTVDLARQLDQADQLFGAVESELRVSKALADHRDCFLNVRALPYKIAQWTLIKEVKTQPKLATDADGKPTTDLVWMWEYVPYTISAKIRPLVNEDVDRLNKSRANRKLELPSDNELKYALSNAERDELIKDHPELSRCCTKEEAAHLSNLWSYNYARTKHKNQISNKANAVANSVKAPIKRWFANANRAVLRGLDKVALTLHRSFADSFIAPEYYDLCHAYDDAMINIQVLQNDLYINRNYKHLMLTIPDARIESIGEDSLHVPQIVDQRVNDDLEAELAEIEFQKEDSTQMRDLNPDGDSVTNEIETKPADALIVPAIPDNIIEGDFTVVANKAAAPDVIILPRNLKDAIIPSHTTITAASTVEQRIDVLEPTLDRSTSQHNFLMLYGAAGFEINVKEGNTQIPLFLNLMAPYLREFEIPEDDYYRVIKSLVGQLSNGYQMVNLLPQIKPLAQDMAYEIYINLLSDFNVTLLKEPDQNIRVGMYEDWTVNKTDVIGYDKVLKTHSRNYFGMSKSNYDWMMATKLFPITMENGSTVITHVGLTNFYSANELIEIPGQVLSSESIVPAKSMAEVHKYAEEHNLLPQQIQLAA